MMAPMPYQVGLILVGIQLMVMFDRDNETVRKFGGALICAGWILNIILILNEG